MGKNKASNNAKAQEPEAKGGKGGKGGKGKTNADAEQKSDNKVKGAQRIEVRHILCTKHGDIETRLTEIKKRGDTLEAFKAVAKEFSEDKARQSGLLGWVSKGETEPEFEAVAFGLPKSGGNDLHIGQAKTNHGYHIIVVDNRK